MTNLERLRHSEGLTQNDIATLIGFHRASYAPVESGKIPPSKRMIVVLEEFFKKPIEFLLSESKFVPEERAGDW